jgi:hypothetical protein
MEAWRDAWATDITGAVLYKGQWRDGMRSRTPEAFRDVLLEMAAPRPTVTGIRIQDHL